MEQPSSSVVVPLRFYLSESMESVAIKQGSKNKARHT